MMMMMMMLAPQRRRTTFAASRRMAWYRDDIEPIPLVVLAPSYHDLDVNARPQTHFFVYLDQGSVSGG